MEHYLLLIYLFIVNFFHSTISFNFALKSNKMAYDISLDQYSIFQNISYYIPTMELCFGTPISQCFNLAISTTIAFILIEDGKKSLHCFNKTFSTAKSTSFYITGTSLGIKLYDPHMILAEVDNDYIAFPQNDSFNSKISFLLLVGKVDFRLPIDGIIGMQKYYSSQSQFDGSQYSLLHYLFSSTKAISEPVFALRYNADGTGNIYFNEDYGNYPRCKSTYKFRVFPYWNCDLNGLYLGQDKIDIEKTSIIFDSFKSIISVPTHVGLKILNEIVKIQGDKCIIKYDLQHQFLLCNKDIVFDDFPDVTLKMNEIDLVLKWKYLFKEKLYQNNDGLISLFAVNNFPKEDDDSWVIGAPGFIDNMLIFNSTDGYIGLLPGNKFIKHRSRKVIDLMLMMDLITGVVLIIITKLRIKQ